MDRTELSDPRGRATSDVYASTINQHTIEIGDLIYMIMPVLDVRAENSCLTEIRRARIMRF